MGKKIQSKHPIPLPTPTETMSKITTYIKQKNSVLAIFIPMVLLYSTSYFQRTAVPGTIFNPLQQTTGFTALQIAGLSASFFYIYAFCQPFIGIIADKYGGIRTTITGGAIFCFGTLLFPLCNHLSLMYLCRMLAGIGASTMYLSLIRDADLFFGRDNFPIILALITIIGYCGGLTGTLPYEQVLKFISWRSSLLIVAIISTGFYLFFLYTQRNFKKTAIAKSMISLQPLWAIMKNPMTWLILYCGAINFSIYFVIQSVFGKKILEDFVKMSSAQSATTIFALTIVCISVLFLSSTFCRIIHNRRKPIIIFFSLLCFLVTVMMCIGTYCKPSAILFVTGYILYAVCGGSFIIFTMLEQEVNKKSASTQSAAFINMACNFLPAFLAMLIGLMLDAFLTNGVPQTGAITVYPAAAYQTLFLLLLLPTALSFIGTLFIPETKGVY
ncbi:MAG: MFS transporter, partial [Lentisphaeria bacterium]